MSKMSQGIGSGLLKVDGEVEIKLWDVLNQREMTRYRLAKITGIRYDTICNYCSNKADLINKEYLRIFCSVLDCEISDLLAYKK